MPVMPVIYGLKCVVQNSYVEIVAPPPVPQNGTMFEDSAFKGVTRLK